MVAFRTALFCLLHGRFDLSLVVDADEANDSAVAVLLLELAVVRSMTLGGLLTCV